jgi:hypothetical protein
MLFGKTGTWEKLVHLRSELPVRGVDGADEQDGDGFAYSGKYSRKYRDAETGQLPEFNVKLFFVGKV